MIIEIRNVGFVNKGAELMLYAVLEKMRQSFPDAKFAMEPSLEDGPAPYAKRAELGFLQKVWLWKYGIQLGDIFSFAPKTFREKYGLVLDKEIDIVLDASGFAYSDQWGPYATKELARACKRWKRNNTKVILLPQALGPFRSADIIKAIKEIVMMSDIIFPRDTISYNYLVEAIGGEKPNIQIAPDFTNLIEGILPDYFDQESNKFCIIPNYRMIDKSIPMLSEAYLPFMINCTKYLLKLNAKPFLLLHEGDQDLVLSEQIRNAVGGRIKIICESHPLKIKGILGTCDGVISSRYHGLVSAMSQGVPSLATGWSHKYKMLFDDYGFPEGLMDINISIKDMQKTIHSITDQHSKKKIKIIIQKKAQHQKSLTEKMWQDVLKVIL